MTSFSDLVSGLSHDRHLKGRQFERVCKWYLQHDPVLKHQIDKVWLWKDWPGRWGADAGIDLVAETHTGDLWAVQAKAYAPSASVTKADIDTFLSESSRPEFAMRLLIATTDHISHNAHRTIAAQEKPVRLVTATELSKADLDWPEHPDDLKAKPLPRKKPRPHQQAAIKEVLKGFEESERGQLIMACGTGKTMVSLWVWEKLDVPTALVVLPSISLLAQTVREWCANAKAGFDFLAVCSDESVTDSDLIVRSASELPFASTTDAREIAAFLAGDGEQRVIFSTYHSTPRVAEALVAGGLIDLIVADEAHRCAGRADGGFSTVLRDEKIPADHRLFMTATPRYLSERVVKAAEDLDVEVVSMDDEAVFGPVFHRLTFGQAIAADLLTDYQVAIIGVEGREYREMAEQAALVQPGGGKVTDARTLAAQAALLKGIAKYDLRRCVTFHSRVARARAFADSLDGVAGSLPVEEQPSGRLWADHVSGAMASSSRDVRLNRLRSLDGCDRGLLTNARCLAEGVDVPALDAIAFIDPRGSQVDIMQAVGRVIRKSPDKQRGTVVLPVFVHDEDDPVEAVRDSAFDTVWKVLNALRAHDEVLGEELDGLRTRLGRLGESGHPSKVVLDLPARVTADFVRAFDVRLVEQTTQSWHAWYGLLLQFLEREGHARVRQGHLESSQKLGSWVAIQRMAFKRGDISRERTALLEALPGWYWDPLAEDWDRYFVALRSFVDREGHARVRQSQMESGVKIGTWATTQRMAFKRGDISRERSALLEALPGWYWDVRADTWDRNFAALEHFVEREGHSRIPLTLMEQGCELGRWVSRQRVERNAGNLSDERIASLDALPGWTWDAWGTQWDSNLAVMRQFAWREGHSRVRDDHVESGFALGAWVGRQRTLFSKGKLNPEKVAQLEALPEWAWDARTEMWKQGFAALTLFVAREGHARVLADHMESGFALGRWVVYRRQDFADLRLSADRIAQLEALPDWSWNPVSDAWKAKFAVLEQFVAREGHARVPAQHSESGVRLGMWVVLQRAAYRKGALSPEKVAQLEALPCWMWGDLSEMQWESRMASLLRYAAREGHADVPADHREGDVPLGQWVKSRRRDFHKGRLSAKRLARLEAVPGWTWQEREDTWDRNLTLIREYTAREGHANVPSAHAESGVALGYWVRQTRAAYLKGRLEPERAQVLAALSGWTWNNSSDSWNRHFALLIQFAAREGHSRVPQEHLEDGARLGTWLAKRRREYDRGELSPERVTWLESLPGWTWHPHERRWERNFLGLERFVAREGHARVPQAHEEDGVKLGRWVANVRTEYRTGRLTPERIALLEAIPGWVWSVRDAKAKQGEGE